MRLAAATSLFFWFWVLPAHAQLDEDMVKRYCLEMTHQFVMPDKTRADCISPSHAIEVEFSEYWHSALGQALHYALWTREIAERPKDFAAWSSRIDRPRKAGIILVCRKARDTCTDHYVRLFRIIEEYRLPITIWDCNQTDATLGDCQQIDMPAPTVAGAHWAVTPAAKLVLSLTVAIPLPGLVSVLALANLF